MKNIIASVAVLTSMILLPLMAQADIISLQSVAPVVAVAPVQIPSPLSCFDFHSTLKMGSKSYEVRGLQSALMHEGWNISVSEYGMFGSDTLAAVNAFQQKYASDILKNGAAPTGSVGRMTRAKLNALYGCSTANSMLGINLTTAPAATTPALPSKVSLSVKSVGLDANGVSGTFCNSSPTDIPAFPVRLRLNGVIRDFNVLGALKMGTCDSETLPYATWGLTFDASSTYGLVSGLDPTSMYKTSQLTFPLVGTTTLVVPAEPGAHLSVRGITIKSNGLQATLCNLGTVDLTSYPVHVTINGTGKDVDVPGAYTHGVCQAVTWTYDQFGLPALPPSGTSINATVNVDPNNTYKETNEFDNSATVVGNI